MKQNKKTDQIYALTVGRDIQVISLECSREITKIVIHALKQNTDEICSQKV